MFTPFAVATPKQAEFLKRVERNEGFGASREYLASLRFDWIKSDGTSPIGCSMTSAGYVALHLREILGPDRNLTKAQAGALWKYGQTPATFRKLVALGLKTADGVLTEDGEDIVYILRKYGVNVG